MLYSVVLASATQHSESAAYTHPPLSLPPSPIPPLQVLTEHRVVLLCYTAASHYLSINIYIWSHIYRRRQWHPTPVLLPGKSHGWRSLVGCSHEVAKSDMTERLHLCLFTFMHWRRKWQPTPVFLPGESQGWGSPVGCRLWGRTESDMTEVT